MTLDSIKDSSRSEERSERPGAGAKVPRFRAAAKPTSGMNRREATPLTYESGAREQGPCPATGSVISHADQFMQGAAEEIEPLDRNVLVGPFLFAAGQVIDRPGDHSPAHLAEHADRARHKIGRAHQNPGALPVIRRQFLAEQSVLI